MIRWLFLASLVALPVWDQTNDWQAGIAQVIAKGHGAGAGFVVAVRAGRAYLLTCAHVVEGDPNPLVYFRVSQEARFPAEVRHLEGGRTDGLALLVVENPPANVRSLESAKSAVGAGTPVIVAGYPVSVGAFTMLPGTVASVRGTELYLDRDTGEGFSGGPVVSNGSVAGMVFGHQGGFGKAIPSGILDIYLRGLDVIWAGDTRPREDPRPETPSGTAEGALRENPKDGLTYVWIPPGKFKMGCPEEDGTCQSEERPVHDVEITHGFWMGRTEVTQAAYQKVMKGNPSAFRGTDRPADKVIWNEAKAYCEAVGMRLPTEAEWEYAARAGSEKPTYAELERVAWYDGNSDGQTHPVAAKKPNAWGLYDLLGNVWEWTADWYDPGYYDQKFSKDPHGPVGGMDRVARGGSWATVARSMRVSVRDGGGPGHRSSGVGFRCAGESLDHTAERAETTVTVTVRENPKDGLKYVLISPGQFTMGCSIGDRGCGDREKPAHDVEISRAFWIGQTEVTQGAYERVLHENPSHLRDLNLPVSDVNWNQAKSYCEAVGMRLPTEAEWEYAARAGTAGMSYGGLGQIAWYDGNSDNQAHKVASQRPNSWGLFDMLGNLWEWTADWYDGSYFTRTVAKDPQGPREGTRRVVRGGSWHEMSGNVRVSYRVAMNPMQGDNTTGFRCAGELP